MSRVDDNRAVLEVEEPPDFLPDLTPVERRGDIWVKRDDLYCIAGVRGGKVRACWSLAHATSHCSGLVTASNRKSPQQIIVAHIARRMGVAARIHLASGAETEEMRRAKAAGAELFQHQMGYNSVICARALADVKGLSGWTLIPFGMQSPVSVMGTAHQVKNLPCDGIERIVVPVGSGIALSGVLYGIQKFRPDLSHIPIIGVQVGAHRKKMLDKYAPFGWASSVSLVNAGVDYHKSVEVELDGIKLDPIYEAKCKPFLRLGDLFWIVGCR